MTEQRDALIARTKDWIGHDPDPRDRAQLLDLLNRLSDPAAAEELAGRMNGRLVFGTAGLRGEIGAGPNCMNTAVVTTATAGLVEYLQQHRGPDVQVVIGYDGRHRSAEFARTAAGVVTAAGAHAIMMPSALPTPTLAFAVNYLGADAGVMVTASHNPPADNGYKVYLGGLMTDDQGRGAQIVPPADAEIMALIEAAGFADEVPTVKSGWEVLNNEIIDRYLEASEPLRQGIKLGDLRVVLTAMHGVGAQTAVKVLNAAGLTDIHLVAEQAEPDPDFPTVAFPNPEEPGALDLAFAKAREVDADLIVALDPDADRCALAVPDATREAGWRQLSGDETGALLGDFMGSINEGREGAVLARSLVSGSLLGEIAASHGLGSAQTLTGFKWIARAPGIIYGYEEAIGYCVNPAIVRDKDGITASLIAVQLAAKLKAEGRTMDDRLDDFAVDFGLHATRPLTFRVEDRSLITKGLAALAANQPKTLAGAKVARFDDLSKGFEGLPPTDGYRIETERGDRVVARPSGTEPKLKCYLEVIEPVADRDALPAAKQAASERLDAIIAELTELLGF